ncbi:hypothetical protein GRX03_15275 [Halovenus sp. WSH3]|uniref:DUF7344 domain-containing protein n=1 Tax=Halovenus carboxidivorans TaxID=2692199 RepID=A0A6B0TDG0_9EURY|nr:hypothetical protein [Halovenus carboxidivorans]MXR52960.1 hypothetical protein [Halovenus carboxidivorans]
MSNHDDTSPDSTGNELNALMTDAEQAAVRTLVDGSITSPIPEREGVIDSLFSALSHPGRRYILTFLLRSEGYVTMSEIVDYVVESTDGGSGPEFRRKVTVKLTHTHLPLLEEEGLLTYNMERQLIQPTDRTKLAAPYLKIALMQCEQLAELSNS